MNIVTDFEIPESLGTMTLPGATLFPGSFLPLYIFEPRYRLMLSRALESHRVFAVVQIDPYSERPVHIGGAGLIRACVQNEDGTSHLVLQGIGRVRFVRWEQESPYYIGQVERLPSQPSDTESSRALMKDIRHLCNQLATELQSFPSKFTTYLESIEDPALFSDLLAATVIPDAAVRQILLEETDPHARLETLRTSLQLMVQA